MEIQRRIGRHVPATAGALSIVSLALVFAAALGRIPAESLPHAPGWFVASIPHLNALISLVAIVTIADGWRAIRRGDVARHRRMMVLSIGLFGAFLVLYLYRLTLVEGATAFPGPENVYRYVYLPVLGVHMVLAMICIPLLYYVGLLAVTTPIHELSRTNHPRIGRIVIPLWMTSFTLGIVVYILLHIVY